MCQFASEVYREIGAVGLQPELFLQSSQLVFFQHSLLDQDCRHPVSVCACGGRGGEREKGEGGGRGERRRGGLGRERQRVGEEEREGEGGGREGGGREKTS